MTDGPAPGQKAAGLLIKNGGENIVGWQGYSFAAARICYPDGHIFKVLTDVPSTNGPSWQDNGFVDTQFVRARRSIRIG